MDRQRLLQQLERSWTALKESYLGLSDSQLMEPGVIDTWSVKDILAHVTTWEEEALKYLPLIITGGRPPRYIQYGGIDAFNAQMTEKKQDLALYDVLAQLDETHHRLLDYIRSVPEEHFTRETRFRRRLRLDTYSHYPCTPGRFESGGSGQSSKGSPDPIRRTCSSIRWEVAFGAKHHRSGCNAKSHVTRAE